MANRDSQSESNDRAFDVGFGQGLCDLLSDELGLVCSFMGREGRIVASSDHARIGTTHDIAARIMRGEMDEYLVTRDEAARSSVIREGANMAVDHEGRRLINFAIAGPLDTVRPLARIVCFCVAALLRIRLEETAARAGSGEPDAAAQHPASLPAGGLTAILDQASVTLEHKFSQLRDAVDNIDQGIVMFDPALRLAVWNKRFIELTGIPADFLHAGLTLEAIFRFNAERGEYGAGEAGPIVERLMAQVNARLPARFVHHRPSGVILEIAYCPLPNGGFVATFTDVTARKRADQALREAKDELEARVEQRTRDLKQSEARFRDFVDSSSDWLWETDSELRFTYFSGRLAELLGQSPDELLGKTRQQLVAPEAMRRAPEKWRAHLDDLAAHRPFHGFEYRLSHADGGYRTVRVSGKPIFAADGSFLGYRGTGADVTRMVQAQRELLRSERLAALGSLVAGIAHEINTPLGIGVTAASFLQEQTREFEKLYAAGQVRHSDMASFLRAVSEAGSSLSTNLRRAVGLVQSFKQVAVDQSSEQRRRFNLREYLDEIMDSLRPTLKRTRHTVQIDCPPDLELDSHPGAFSQILANLIMNSLQHGFAGMDAGRIEIAAERTDRQLLLRYADNGCGMIEAHAKRVFEPFFTTRRGQGGSGLGLHIVYNLVTQTLRGRIDCHTAPAAGVKFLISIPIEEPSHDEPNLS